MVSHWVQVLTLIGTIITIQSNSEFYKSNFVSIPQSSSNLHGIYTSEPRHFSTFLGGLSSESLYANNIYQTPSYSGYLPHSSTGSLFSPFRLQGGRRSSFTSRIRNLLNAIFKRETSSPFQASGSSYSYSFRQPSFGFSPIQSGLTSYSSSLDASNPSFLSSSEFRPMSSFPNPYQASSNNNAWNGYKQWASSINQPTYTQFVNPSSSSFSWNSNPSSRYQRYNTGSISDSGSYASSSSLSSGSSNNAYQSSSNSFPSTSYSSSGYQTSSVSSKRSSASDFKPIISDSGSTETLSSLSSFTHRDGYKQKS